MFIRILSLIFFIGDEIDDTVEILANPGRRCSWIAREGQKKREEIGDLAQEELWDLHGMIINGMVWQLWDLPGFTLW